MTTICSARALMFVPHASIDGGYGIAGCAKYDDGHKEHKGPLRGYNEAGELTMTFPTIVTWFHDDRRTFTGDGLPKLCAWVDPPTGRRCVLQEAHRGKHAP